MTTPPQSPPTPVKPSPPAAGPAAITFFRLAWSSARCTSAGEATSVQQDRRSIAISQVASVEIQTGIIWSQISIDSTGGADPITSHAIARPMRSAFAN